MDVSIGLLTSLTGLAFRGLIRLFQRNCKGGVSDYDKAPQYDPSDAFSWNNRGQARLRLGDKQGARRALELKPDLDSAQDSLRKLGAL
jgi:hypothetical protein